MNVTGKAHRHSTPNTRNAARDRAAQIGHVQATAARVSADILETVQESTVTPYVAVTAFYAFLHLAVSAVERVTL